MKVMMVKYYEELKEKADDLEKELSISYETQYKLVKRLKSCRNKKWELIKITKIRKEKGDLK